MKIKSEVARELLMMEEDESYEDYLVIEIGGWISEGKRSHQCIIIRYKGSYYEIRDSREGSYHTDYYFESEYWKDEIELIQVEPIKVTTTKWKAV